MNTDEHRYGDCDMRNEATGVKARTPSLCSSASHLCSSVSLAFLLAATCCAQDFEAVTPGKVLEFPRDAGSHPAHRIEWWYVTGQLDTTRGPMGFQVTFFRLRNRDAEGNPSRFSATQLLFAHAALADPAKGRLLHDERSARAWAYGLVARGA